MANEFGTLDRPGNVLETLESYSHHIALRSYKISLESKLASPSSLSDEVLEKETIVLAASGGTAPYPNRLGTATQKNDVFIQSLRMTNTNGLNGGGEGRISPVTQMEMSIVETGGAEFLAALTAGTAILNQRDQVQTVVLKQEAPFLITISFNDQTKSGKRKDLSGYTKHIKVRITKCQFSVKATGVYYELLCTPYPHMALTDMFQNSAIGGGYTLEGSTIGEFINGPKGLAAALKQAVASNNKDAKGNIESPYEYEFKFHNSIAEAFRDSVLAAVSAEDQDTNIDSMPFNRVTDLIPPAQEQSASGSGTPTATTQKDAKSTNKETQNSVATTGNIRKIHINKETPIHVVIERLVMNSSHIKEIALKDPKNYPPFVPFVKVIPMVKTDDQTNAKDQNKIKKKVIYNIVGIQIPFVRAIDIGNDATAKQAIDKIKSQTFKSYNYLFTGGNRSILNFDLRYDNLFQQAYTSWNRTFANQNSVTDRQSVDPKNDQVAASANQAPADNAKNVQTANSQDQKDIPLERQAQRNTDEDSGMPKDYASAAQWFRTNLSEIFANQVEKSVYRIQVDLVGDPDFISEVDTFPTQEAFEAKVAALGGGSAAAPATPGTAGSPGTGSLPPGFNPFEPYYLQFVIGNSLGNSFNQVEFAGYYLPLRFTHSFDKGKFVTQVDAVRVQGVNLKAIPQKPDAGTAPAVPEPTPPAAAGGSGSTGSGGTAGGGLGKVLGDVANAKSATTAALGAAKDTAVNQAQGVANKMPPGSSGSPGNTPPQEFVTGAGKVAAAVTLPATTAAPKSLEEAKATAGKLLGGTIDSDPAADVKSAPSTQSLIDTMKSSNKLSEDLQKLSATVPDITGKMATEMNSMMDGLGSKVSGMMSGAMNAASGLAASAGNAAKAGLSKLSGKLGGAAKSLSTTGTSNVTEAASNAMAKAAPELASAAVELSAKIPSFQIPGMPIMAGPTTEDLTKKIKEAAPAIGAAAGEAAGALSKAAAGAAGAASKAAAGATSALSKVAKDAAGAVDKAAAGAADLVSSASPDDVKAEGSKLTAAITKQVKDVMGTVGAVDTKAALNKAKEAASGIGMAAPDIAKSLGGALGGASTALSGAAKSLAGKTGPLAAAASSGASALSGVVAAASKGLGGTSLSEAVKTSAAAASGPLSGLKNEVSALADKAKSFKFPEVEINVPQLSGEIASAAEKAKGELAKLTASTVGSTPGLSALDAGAKEEISKKLSIGALARANAFANTIPGSVKPVGLNDVAPAMVMNAETGLFEAAPTPAELSAMKENAANLNKSLTASFQKNLAPSLQKAAGSVSSAARGALPGGI